MRRRLPVLLVVMMVLQSLVGLLGRSRFVLVHAAVSTNLVGSFPFSGSAEDDSSLGNDGSLQGSTTPQLTTDRNGEANKAYTFSGTTSYVNVPYISSYAFSDGLTVAAWIYPTGVDNNDGIVGQWNDVSGEHSWYMKIQGSGSSVYYRFEGKNSAGTQFLDVSWNTAVSINTWTFIACTFDNIDANLYINGALEKSEAVSGQLDNANQDIIIGAVATGSGIGEYFNGKIDSVFLYDRAISAAKIAALYATDDDLVRTVAPTPVPTSVPTAMPSPVPTPAPTPLKTCPPGTFGNHDPVKAVCEQCPVGRASALAAQTTNVSCAACLPGTYAAVTGSVTCTSCMTGTYQPAREATACENCPQGRYGTTEQAVSLSNCTQCEAGTASSVSGANSSAVCTPCDPGYISSAGDRNCSVCPANTYQPTAGGVECLDCASGLCSLAGSTAATDCTTCVLSISSVSGCDDSAAATAGETAECPTEGGNNISLAGSQFLTSAGLSATGVVTDASDINATVLVSTRNCTILRATNTEIVCLLPPGAGVGVSVVVTTPNGAAVSTALSYTAPVVTHVTGCNDSDTEALPPNGTSSCPRDGNVSITVSGTNFGPDEVTVFVAGQAATTLQSYQTQAVVTLPQGTSYYQAVNVLQSNGQLSEPAYLLSYRACGKGYKNVLDDSGVFTCVRCQKGEYSTALEVFSCTTCPARSYCPNVDSDPIECDKSVRNSGSVVGSFLESNCTCPTEDNTKPVRNGTGKVCMCPPGTEWRSRKCSPCPENSYQPFNLSDLSESCTNCPKDMITVGAGKAFSTDCVCPQGMYQPSAGANTCEDDGCDEGFDCDQSGYTLPTLPIDTNYWRETEDSSKIYPCPDNNGACIGTTSKEGATHSWGEHLCKDGHAGVMCQVCKTDWYWHAIDNECKACNSDSSSAAAGTAISVVIVLTCVFVFLDYAWRGKESIPYRLGPCVSAVVGAAVDAMRSSEAGEAQDVAQATGEDLGSRAVDEQAQKHSAESVKWRTRLRIFVSFAQVISALPWVLQVRFPASFERFLDVLAIMSFNFVKVLPLQCMTPHTLAIRLLASTITPLLLMLVLYIMFHLQKQQQHSRVLQNNESRANSARAQVATGPVQVSPENDDPPLPPPESSSSSKRSPGTGNLTESSPVSLSPPYGAPSAGMGLSRASSMPIMAVATAVMGQSSRELAMQKDLQTMRANLAEIRARFFNIATVTLFLLLPSVSATVLSVWATQAVGDREYLRADYRLHTGMLETKLIQRWAFIMALVYPIGVPLTFWRMLWVRRDQLNPTLGRTHRSTMLEATRRAVEHQADTGGDVFGRSVLFVWLRRQELGRHRVFERMSRSQHAPCSPASRSLTRNTAGPYHWRPAKWFAHAWQAATAGFLQQQDTDVGLIIETHKASLRAHDESLAPVSFLFEPYKPSYFWWEVVETARRLCLTSLLILCFEGTPTQIVLALIIVLVGNGLYSAHRPYLEPDYNSLAQITGWETFFVLFMALLFRVEVSSDQNDAWGVALICVCLIGVLVTMYHVAVENRQLLGEMCWCACGGQLARQRSTIQSEHNADDEDPSRFDPDTTTGAQEMRRRLSAGSIVVFRRSASSIELDHPTLSSPYSAHGATPQLPPISTTASGSSSRRIIVPEAQL